MSEREQFSFSPESFGIMSTEEVAAGEMFLNSDPGDLKFIPKKKPNTAEDEEPENEEEEEDASKKPVAKRKDSKSAPKKEDPVKGLDEKTFFNALEGDSEPQDEEEDEEEDTNLGTQGEKKDSDSSEPGSEEQEENVYSAIAQELLSHGVFSLDEDEEELEVETPEDLLQRFQLEGKKQAFGVIEKFLGRYGDDYRDMFENVFVKGVKPVDYLNRYTKIEALGDIDLTDEANQERVVRDLYRSEGKSSEYIEKRVTQLKNYNDLLDEATEAKRILIEKEQSAVEQEAERKKTEQINTQQKRNAYVNSVGRIINEKIKSKEFDGIPVDRNFATETFSYITEERFQTPDGQLLTTFDRDILELNRPENHEIKIKLAMLLQMVKQDPQLTKLSKRAVSKESSELFKGLKKTAIKTKNPPAKEETPKSWFQ